MRYHDKNAVFASVAAPSYMEAINKLTKLANGRNILKADTRSNNNEVTIDAIIEEHGKTQLLMEG